MDKKTTENDEKNTKIEEKNAIQVGFYLSEQHEKDKLEQLARHYGLGVSGLLRMLILKDWRKEFN